MSRQHNVCAAVAVVALAASVACVSTQRVEQGARPDPRAALPPVPDADPGRYARNALERCKALPEPDRNDCVLRMQGRGTTSGSVEGGGIYRELVTIIPGEAPAPR